MEPVWSCGAALPNSLRDLMDTGDHREEEKQEEDNEDEFYFDDVSETNGWCWASNFLFEAH